MAWRLSTGLIKALLGGINDNKNSVDVATISFGNGDGTVISGADTINDSGNSLAVFTKHAFALIIGGANDGIVVKILDSTAAKLEVSGDSFSSASGAAQVCLVEISGGGSILQLFRNSTIDLYSGARPASADNVESGTLLLSITLDGDAFVAGVPENGINLGQFVGNTLKRAIDPFTGLTEIWKGAGIADGSALSARWYANDKTTGASTAAIRMDGVVATSGADLDMVNGTTIATGIFSEVSDVEMDVTAV